MEEKKVYKIGLMPLLLLILDIILIIVIIIMGIIIKNKNEKLKKALANNSDVNSESVVHTENTIQSENTTSNTTSNTTNKVSNTITDTNIIANKKDEPEDSSEVQYTGKIVENKSYIYDAQYTPSAIKVNKYSTNDGNSYSISDIVVPYINMNSDYAEKANSEIEQLYSNYVEEFKVCSQNKNSYIKVNYETYITSNIHSILITIQRGKDDTEAKEYISYNFDNISGEKLDYNQVCYVAGVTDASTSVQNAINNLEDFNNYYLYVDRYNNQEKVDERNKQIENNKQQIFASYQQELLNNKLVYFLDNNLRLNIILEIVLPDEESYTKIVTI